MASQWLRCVRWLVAGVASLFLVACGSGSIESQLKPTRVVAFGDGFADLGQNGARYTVNDASVNNWSQVVSTGFALTLNPSATGGFSYAVGNARITATPDAAGNAATPTVEAQINTFLAASTPAPTDLLLVNAGISDVTVQVSAALAGTQSREQMLANVGQAGRELAAQTRRLVQAGAKQVVVVGSYNLARSPWGASVAEATPLLEAASSRFNDQLLIALVDLGANVLYLDVALYLNLVTSAPVAYGIEREKDPVCTSVDAGPGIGTGSGQINSNLCTPATVPTGANTELWLFADRLYPSPRGHRLFGEYAFNRIRERW